MLIVVAVCSLLFYLDYAGNAYGWGSPTGLVFGPDGNLYVADGGFSGSTPAVLRFQGSGGPTPGAFMGAFVPAGRGGLLQPFGVLFGPDRNDHEILHIDSAGRVLAAAEDLDLRQR